MKHCNPFLRRLCFIFVVMISVITGCGSSPVKPPINAGSPPYKKELGTCHVVGVVKYDGIPPDRSAVDKATGMPIPDAPLKEDLVASDGRLQNGVVYISAGWERWSYPLPEKEALLDQKNCRYIPHVITLQTHQPLVFHNSDDKTHNVHGLPKINRPQFNLPLDDKDARSTHTFNTAEIGIRVQCDVHKWSHAFVSVFDHPFHAVTNEKGEFQIDGLPPGDYEITLWHESELLPTPLLSGVRTQKITVKENETNAVEWTLKAAKK